MNEFVHRYVAVNTAEESTNRIHSNEMAREYGFEGALVPGSATYAHSMHAVCEQFKESWFTGGTAYVRFPSPVYTGDDVVVTVGEPQDGQSAVTSSVADAVRARGHATDGAGTQVPTRKTFPTVELPSEPIPISEELVLDRPWLGSVELKTDHQTLEDYRASIGLPAGVAHELGFVHPGYLAGSYVEIMRPNLARSGPSVHASTLLTSHKPALIGEPLSLRGRIERLFGRNGHRYWMLEMAWYDADENIVMHAEHTSIYHLRAPKKEAVNA